MNFTEIEEWLTKKLQPVDNVLTDYVSIRQRIGNSYEQVGRVKTDGKDPKDAAAAVLDAVRDVYQSADSEGKPSIKLQLKIYRAKEEDGCRVFSGGSVEVETLSTGREGELVSVVRELRILAGETTTALARVSSSGLELAVRTLKENGDLRGELAETKAALFLAENSSQPDKLSTMLEAVLPVVLAKMQGQ